VTINGPNGLTLSNSLTGNGATTVTKFTLAVTASGPGTVTQTPTGTSFANNTTITLTATPNANATFVNWGGVCPNTSQTTCTFILNANTTATANFAANVTLTTVVVGPGAIMQSPTGTSFVPGSSVFLTATPNSGAQFVGWAPSSACLPETPFSQCVVTLNANTTITATFTGPQVSLSTNVVGPGSIQQTPSGTSFASGTSITLTAVPSANATFTSWAGACAGSTTNTVCTFMLTANTSVTATFTANPAVTVPQTPPPAPAGSTITAPITLTGFAMPPTLKASCTIPQGNCSISGTTLTVTTTARSSGLVPGRFPRVPSLPAPPRGVMIIALAMMSLALLAKNSRAKQFLRPAALVGALLFAGCGGGSNTPPPVTGTPAGNYTVTITATLGAQTAMTSVVITVQ
jgi:Divergent InlB B-repeat domain